MSQVTSTLYYLFTREQLLQALEEYSSDRGVPYYGADASCSAVLEFLGSPAAAKHGLVVAPAPIDVRENSV
jgi:hypothetical protein